MCGLVYTACPRESTGSHLITEVLLGRVSVQMGNHPSVPTDLNLTLGFFSRYSGVQYLPLQKLTPSQKHLVWVLYSGIMHDCLVALPNSGLGAASSGD